MERTTHREVVATNVRIEAARRRATQADLAGVLAMSQQAMSRRLTGEVAFDVDELHQLAEFFEVDVAHLTRSDETAMTGT